ncbi:fimbrial protein [Klebsiella michiganensis]|uniref:fimbrial protein n=1 Tax=Klebsiella michiganensis TaxID=1134687 RepID=UPI0034D5751B
MKLFSRLFIILSLTIAGWSSVALGYTGQCSPVNGTNIFSYDFGSLNISNPADNIAGKVYPDVYEWNLSSGGYQITCDCDPNIPNQAMHYSASSNLPLGHTDGDLQYFKVNDYLEVATKVYIAGGVNSYVPVPFTSIDSTSTYSCATYSQGGSMGSGKQGELSLYIAKPFVGTVTINATVVDLYASMNDSSSASGTPMAQVNISGQVIVPQTCTINAGQIVTVDFGSFMSGEFKNKGQMPTGYTPKTITVPIKCNGMDANASLTLRFQAEASADEPAAIKTSNDDVGVQITDDSGKVIEPNSGLIPFQLDDNLQATVTFHAAPISTTGNAPAEGTFSATAYIRVDFA